MTFGTAAPCLGPGGAGGFMVRQFTRRRLAADEIEATVDAASVNRIDVRRAEGYGRRLLFGFSDASRMRCWMPRLRQASDKPQGMKPRGGGRRRLVSGIRGDLAVAHRGGRGGSWSSSASRRRLVVAALVNADGDFHTGHHSWRRRGLVPRGTGVLKMSTTVNTCVEDSIAILELNRPEACNALSPEMMRALREAVEAIAQNDAVRCVIIRGAGNHFMAGGDVKAFHAMAAEQPERRKAAIAELFPDVNATILTLKRMPKPVIASVRGATAGFGVSLMAACDLTIAAEDSVFSIAYRHIGLSPDGGLTWFLPRLVGLKRAMEMVLMGNEFDAATAQSIGLVNRVVATSRLDGETRAWAGRLASGPALALGHAKTLLNAASEATLESQLTVEKECFIDCFGTDDCAEGLTAFVEKRSPRFSPPSAS